MAKDLDGLELRGFSKINSAYPVRRSNSGNAILEYEILAVGRLANPFAVWLSSDGDQAVGLPAIRVVNTVLGDTLTIVEVSVEESRATP